MQFIQTVGPTAAIAIFLVYVIAAQVNPALDSIKDFMQQHVDQSTSMIENMKQQADIESKQWDALSKIAATEHADHEKALALQEQTCINGAKSQFQTQKCIEARNVGEVQ